MFAAIFLRRSGYQREQTFLAFSFLAPHAAWKRRRGRNKKKERQLTAAAVAAVVARALSSLTTGRARARFYELDLHFDGSCRVIFFFLG